MEEYAVQVIESGVPLSFSDLYRLTLPEVSAIMTGYKSRVKLQKVFFGNVTAAIYNVNRQKGSRKILKWSDIYPPDKENSRKEMTPEEISIKLHAMFGGVRR